MDHGAPWVATAAVCAIGAALAAPEWVPHQWSREDGPLEYATFACFLVSSVAALAASARLRSAGRPALAAAALGLVLFVAAGEEVSWGQRWFGIETPDALVDGNRQDELNLHNVEGLQDKAVLAQLGIAGAGIALALRVPRRWARAGLPFFAGYVAYRGGRGVGAVVGWGAADRNSEAAELLLAVGLLVLTLSLLAALRARARAEGRLEREALEACIAPLRSRRGRSTPARPPVARPS
jgi:hypothetical protein